jgi:ribosomal-protein-alanine N-acetyltransferase
MNRMVLLETDRLRFREHEPRDLEAFCALEQDADFRRYVGGRPRTRNEAEQRFERFLAPVTGPRLVATELKDEGRYIGYCGLHPHVDAGGPVAREAALAFYLAPDVWRQGFATEAGRAWIRFGFERLELTRIVASVDARNAASLRVLEKLGFQWRGTTGTAERPIHELELRAPLNRRNRPG